MPPLEGIKFMLIESDAPVLFIVSPHDIIDYLRKTEEAYFVDLDQRDLAARFAIRLRRAAERLSALALPPFNPPSLPRATAAGFFRLGSLARRHLWFAPQ